jgi:hypothetical protein
MQGTRMGPIVNSKSTGVRSSSPTAWSSECSESSVHPRRRGASQVERARAILLSIEGATSLMIHSGRCTASYETHAPQIVLSMRSEPTVCTIMPANLPPPARGTCDVAEVQSDPSYTYAEVVSGTRGSRSLPATVTCRIDHRASGLSQSRSQFLEPATD